MPSHEHSLDDLLRIRIEDDDPSARARAYRELATRFETEAHKFFLSDAVEDSSPIVRAEYARLLGDLPYLVEQRDTIHWLTGCLTDSDASVRLVAIESLQKRDRGFQHTPALGALVIMAVEDNDLGVQEAARSTLLDVLLETSSDDDGRGRSTSRLLLEHVIKNRLAPSEPKEREQDDPPPVGDRGPEEPAKEEARHSERAADLALQVLFFSQATENERHLARQVLVYRFSGPSDESVPRGPHGVNVGRTTTADEAAE